jgi:hypothetical protein
MRWATKSPGSTLVAMNTIVATKKMTGMLMSARRIA